MEVFDKIVHANSSEMSSFIDGILNGIKPKRIIINDPPEDWKDNIDWKALLKERDFDYKNGVLIIHTSR